MQKEKMEIDSTQIEESTKGAEKNVGGIYAARVGKQLSEEMICGPRGKRVPLSPSFLPP